MVVQLATATTRLFDCEVVELRHRHSFGSDELAQVGRPKLWASILGCWLETTWFVGN
jgi:hypothetical protein